jgi:lambda family phage portal protein
MLDGYSEAELTAARVSAGKMGFYKQADPEDIDAELSEDGKLVQEATAGAFELLPKGVEFQSFDPQHPNTAFKDFVAALQRQAAAGANVSYAAFANDPGSLNYSGLRHVALEDRDEWRTLQDWLIGAFPMRFFGEWLEDTLTSGITGLPPSKFFKFNAPLFRARGWQWVDPQNEIAALREELALSLTSRTKAAAERGEDLADIVADLEREAAMGLTMPQPAGAQPKPAA